MQKSIFNTLLNLTLLYILCYASLFILFQFYTPDLGDITITAVPNDHTPELQQINLSLNKMFDKYYLLIFEENSEDTWMYFYQKTHDKSSEFLISQFIPNPKSKYVLLEGDNLKNTFSFKMKSKYPLTYMSNKESKFHLYYIVPHKFFPFPTFYYSKHFTFFVDPIM